jgi:superfamily II DNA or RNA helicase
MSITPKGYRIDVNNNLVKEIQKDLTVKPFNPSIEYTKSYKVYRKSEKYIYCPKYYAIKKVGLPSEIIFHNLELYNINFNKNLREYQEEVANKVLNHIINNYSGVCSLFTGWGKTCLALWLSSKLKVKTLIVVHTNALLEQWLVKIKDFTGIDAGIIQQDKILIDAPICVGIIHSLCLRKYPKEVTEGFGFIVFDEVHHTPSEMFSGVFYNMCIKYSLGLSATLNRKDGLSKVINWFLGDTIVDIKQVTNTPKIEFLKFYPSELLEEHVMINGKPNLPKMISELTINYERNALILERVKNLYDEGRNILILTDRREHAENLKSKMTNLSCGLYLGKMKINELNDTNNKRIIIGTYQMASEGYDNPKLDTLILSTPKSDVEQCIGRILRQENSNYPLVVDIQDYNSVFTGMNFKRKNFYKKKGFLNDNSTTTIDFRE